jgi:hypothetical protein
MHLARRLRPLIGKPFSAHMFYITVPGCYCFNGYCMADTLMFVLGVVEQDFTGHDEVDFQDATLPFVPQIPSRRTVSR